MDKIKKTKDAYGFLWTKVESGKPHRWHCNDIEEQIGAPLVRGTIGLDAGSGCGFDTYIMAKDNPSVKIVSLDISDGVYKTKELTLSLNNVWIIKGSVLDLPIEDEAFDFAYSYGMLHHTPDPYRGIREIARVLKEDSPVYLYLYEDHSENIIKYCALKFVNLLRRVTIRINPRVLYVLSFLSSPFVVIFFSFPSGILRRFAYTKRMAEKMPFNFGTHLFSLTGDLYDRFSAPIEYRFSKKEVYDFLNKNGFTNVKVDRLKSKAGWIAWGCKNKC